MNNIGINDNELKTFRFYCCKILPLVYDDSLSYYELLCKCVKYINSLIEADKILSNEFEALKKDVNDIQSIIDNFDEELAQRVIAIVLEEMRSRKIICIGDSYLAYSSQEQETTSWGAFLRIYLGSNETVILKGLGGSGFIGNAQKTFIQLLGEVELPEGITANEITDVIVLGGMNDAVRVQYGNVTFADIDTAIGNFIGTVATDYPNANIHIGFLGWMGNGFENRDTYVPYFAECIEVYRKCTFHDRRGKVKYINDIEYVMPPKALSAYKADLIHPTTTTSADIGMKLANYLLTGKCTDQIIFYSTGQQQVTASGISTGVATGGNALQILTNGKRISISGLIGMTMNNAEIGSTVYEYEIATIASGALRGTTSRPVILEATAVIFPGKEGTYDAVPCQVSVRNGKMYARFFTNTSLGNYTGITQINFYFGTQEFDTLYAC